MSEAIFTALEIILCFIGIYYILSRIFSFFISSGCSDNIYCLILPHSCPEALPECVYKAMILWSLKPLGKREVFVSDTGVPEYIKARCRYMAGDMGRVYFIKPEDISSINKIYENND